MATPASQRSRSGRCRRGPPIDSGAARLLAGAGTSRPTRASPDATLREVRRAVADTAERYLVEHLRGDFPSVVASEGAKPDQETESALQAGFIGCTTPSTAAHTWPRRTRIPSGCAGRSNTGRWRRSCDLAAASDHEYSVGVVGPPTACAASAPAREHQHQHSHASRSHLVRRQIQGRYPIVVAP